MQNAIATLSGQLEVTSADVTSAITGALNSLLPSGALDSFSVIAGSPMPQEIRYTIMLDGTIVDRDAAFNLGLPSVLTTTSGDVHVALGYTTQLVLGFSTTTGVYVDTAAASDFALDMVVTSPSLQLSGKLGILPFTAVNGATVPATGLSGVFSVDFVDADNHLHTSDVAGLGVNSVLTGDATVNLDLTTDLGSALFPTLYANLRIDWPVNEPPNVPLTSWGDVPQVSFNNIGLDVGSFFQSFVGPVFDQIDQALAPVQPVLELLSTPIPVLSDVVGHDVTVAELATTVLPFFTHNPNSNLDMLETLVEFYALYQDLGNLAGSGMMSLGSFHIDGDVRGLSSLENVTLTIIDPPSDSNPKVTEFLARTHASAFQSELAFPILENPQKVFDVLLGRDVELFHFNLPTLTAGFGVSAYIPIFGFFGVRIGGSFDVGIDLGFGYDTSGLRQWSQTNFDPAEEDKVLDGFFLIDLHDGVDSPEAFVQARIDVSAEANVGVADVGIGGAIIATVGLDLRDRVIDGKVHPSEILANIAELGPLCGIFEHTGSVDVALTAYADVGVGPFSVGVSIDIITVRLADFTFPCTPGGTPTLAHLDEDTHELTLFTGPEAIRRYSESSVDDPIDPLFWPAEPDMDETYLIRWVAEDQDTGLDILEVSAFGKKEYFTGVSTIIADGGKGNDIIQIGDDVNAVAYLDGGPGNDRLIAGKGGGVIHGDGGAVAGAEGDDEIGGYGGFLQLYGDGGNDIIHGGADGDLISGGDGDDLIFGNGGVDVIGGGAGNDLIDGGADNDILSGNVGNDDIRGSDGNDTIYGQELNGTLSPGEEDNDILRGGEGDNTVWGGFGDDAIYTLSGVDTIHGEAGIDTIFAGEGIDTVYGGDGNDEIHGEGGNDQLFGEAGADKIYGDAGDDTIHGGTEDDEIHGGTGNDTVYGEQGADSIYGDEDDDELYGNAGTDNLYGGTGRDRIWGGSENDNLYGEDDIDALYGEQGDDFVGGGAGDDLIDGGMGDDTLFGDAGVDRIYGREGNDVLRGFGLTGTDDNTGDYLYGEAGDDWADGGGGNDIVDGGAGVDTLYGGAGDDVILAGTGIGDHLYGDDGNDTITGSDEGSDIDANFLDAVYFGDVIDGGAGNDTIYGLGGADYILGGVGDDWIDSGFGSDWIRGGLGNDYLYAGRGLGERIDGEEGEDVIYGSDEGADMLYGGAGRDQIYGQGGDDTISGDADDDHLDGGAGTDIVMGGLGNDTLYGGGGVGDQLDGGDGDDVLHGSDDGADVIVGGLGRDLIYGHGGNDSLSGGDGDDIIDGGAGDDTISGDAGSDLLVGGADHDTIYGHSVSGAGDDGAVDYIYGDFGTDKNESGSGRDQLFGQGGSDLIWGEGNDDFIDAGAGTSDLVYYGTGESGTPSDFVPPTPTAPPTVQSVVSITHATANLPTGPDTQGRWSELAGSGSRDGFSQSSAAAIEPAIVVTAAGIVYAAWADARHGNYEIYVARFTPGVGWEELPGGTGFSAAGGSASEGGVSNTAGSSRRPSIAIDNDGNPIVAWTEFSGASSNVRVAKFDPTAAGGAGAWIALATSLDAGGISGTNGADSPVQLITSGGPVVAWLDSSSGTTQVYAKRYSGGTWSGLGSAQFASGTGVSQAAASVIDFAAATDGTKVAVAWTEPDANGSQVFLREFGGSSWGALGGSTTGRGISDLDGTNNSPTLAYSGGILYAAWQGNVEIRPEVYAKRFTGGMWQQAGGSPQFGVSATLGYASQPQLVSGGGELHLVWADDARANRTGTAVGIFAKRWNGSDFLPEFALDARTPGVASTQVVDSLRLAVDSAGKPFVVWSEPGQNTSQVYLLANTQTRSGRVFTASPAVSVQSILDAEDLEPGDVIELTDGTLAGFDVSANDSGVTIVGSPGATINGAINILAASDVTLQRVAVTGLVTVNGGAGNAAVGSFLLGGVSLLNTTDAQLMGNLILGDGVELAGAVRPVVQRNSIVSAAHGIRFATSASSDVSIRQNTITAASAGIEFAVAAGGTIVENDIDGGTTGLDILEAFTGLISANEIHDSTTGVIYGADAALGDNRIHDNTTGVAANVATQAAALGFVLPPVERASLPMKSMPTRSAFNSPARYRGSIFSII